MAMSTGKVVALIQAMGGADPAVIESAVQDWLDAHPEATTTVQDGSITEQKLATSIAQKLGLISSLSDDIVNLKSEVRPISDRVYDIGMVFHISRSEGEGTTKWLGMPPSNGTTLKFKNNSNVNINIIGKKGSQTSTIINALVAGQTAVATISDDFDMIGVYFYSYGSGELLVYGSDYINDMITTNIESKFNSIFSQISIDWISGYYVRYNDGLFVQSDSSQYTGYIECSNIALLKLYSYISTAGATLAFYDENLNYMQNVSVQGTNAIQDIAVEMPTNAKYFVCSHYGTGDKNIIAYSKLESATNILVGKKIMFFGDSITANNNGYRKHLVDKTGMIPIASFAINGATLTNSENTVMDGNPTENANNTVPNQVKKMTEGTYETPDIVIVSASTNDSESHFVFKESEYQIDGSYIDIDTCDLTNASGAMRWIYEKIMSVYPNAKVFFATPIQSATPARTFASLKTKRDIIVQNAERMSIAIVDAFYNSGIYSRYETNGANGKYLSDGLHPNADGAVLLGDFYAVSIRDQFN